MTLVPASSYTECCKRAAFWRATHRGGEDFKRVKDECGDPVLPRYARETEDAYGARMSGTPVFNLAEDMVSKRVGEVFKHPVQRRSGNGRLDEFLADVDQRGHSMDEWMGARLEEALITGIAYIGVDAPTAQERSALASQADVQQLGIGPYATWAPVENVVDWEESREGFRRIVVKHVTYEKSSLMDKPVETTRYVEWTPTEWRRYVQEGDEKGETKLTLEETGRNEFGIVPWRKLEPLPGTSYVGRFAGLLKSAVRTASHMEAEEVANVWSLPVISGASPDQVQSPPGPCGARAGTAFRACHRPACSTECRPAGCPG